MLRYSSFQSTRRASDSKVELFGVDRDVPASERRDGIVFVQVRPHRDVTHAEDRVDVLLCDVRAHNSETATPASVTGVA